MKTRFSVFGTVFSLKAETFKRYVVVVDGCVSKKFRSKREALRYADDAMYSAKYYVRVDDVYTKKEVAFLRKGYADDEICEGDAKKCAKCSLCDTCSNVKN